MKRDLILNRLDGLAERNRQRLAKRRLMQAEHLERKRAGRLREYCVDKTTRTTHQELADNPNSTPKEFFK
jgi:hypothetical protein